MAAILQQGDSGDDVRELQRTLVDEMYFGPSQIDGYFGPITKQAVEDFQAANNLVVDGIVGGQTWAALPVETPTPMLQIGSDGQIVAHLQQALAQMAGSGVVSPGPIDAQYGPQTANSVSSFQQYAGLTQDGICGDQTWYASVGAASKTLEDLAGL